MRFLLLLLLVSPAYSFMCHTYINVPERTLIVGPLPCESGKCSSMVARLSNGQVWKLGGCDKKKQCQGTGGRKIMSTEEFKNLIKDAPVQVPAEVTSVDVDAKCCTTNACNDHTNYTANSA